MKKRTTAKKSDLNKLISLRSFLHDRFWFIFLYTCTYILIILFLFALKVETVAIIVTTFILKVFLFLSLLIDYLRRRAFYLKLTKNITRLDQAYLVLETLEEPNFYDGRIFYEFLYEINKSMLENVRSYREKTEDFQEYIELWLHEVKTPLATLSLMSSSREMNEQLKRLDDYIDQILYYTRAENSEKDYMIKEVDLEKIIGNIANSNKDILLARNIDFQTKNLHKKVYSDPKWLEFILNQIINNSIKYGSSKIFLETTETNDTVTLIIRDNGVGISKKDLPRVFDKTFTGENGHSRKSDFGSSTGMGLYIAKTLCSQLGHHIAIDSEENRGTAVSITFSKNEYYKVTKK